MRTSLLAAILAASVIPLCGQVHILASNGVRTVIEDLKPQIERTTGTSVAIDYGTSTALKQKIESGDKFDLAIITSDLVDQLARAGKLSSTARVNVARCGVGVGVKRGAPKPDIKTVDALKRTLVAAKSVAYAGDGASRTSIEKMFDRMGIADAMKRKAILTQGSVAANEKVAGGSAEMILTLVSEILPVPGVELVGPLPAEFQGYVSFSAAANGMGANSPAVSGILKLLGSPNIESTLRAKGMEPVR